MDKKEYVPDEHDIKYGPFTVEINLADADIRYRFQVGTLKDALKANRKAVYETLDRKSVDEWYHSSNNWRIVQICATRLEAQSCADDIRQILGKWYEEKFGEICCFKFCGKEHIDKPGDHVRI